MAQSHRAADGGDEFTTNERDAQRMSYSELADAGILGKRQAEAYTLRELEGHSREETAALMGVSPNTVDEHLATARSKIEAARRTVELVGAEGSA